jgi:hypothetical protein
MRGAAALVARSVRQGVRRSSRLAYRPHARRAEHRSIGPRSISNATASSAARSLNVPSVTSPRWKNTSRRSAARMNPCPRPRTIFTILPDVGRPRGSGLPSWPARFALAFRVRGALGSSLIAFLPLSVDKGLTLVVRKYYIRAGQYASGRHRLTGAVSGRIRDQCGFLGGDLGRSARRLTKSCPTALRTYTMVRRISEGSAIGDDSIDLPTRKGQHITQDISVTYTRPRTRRHKC